ncbi:MAG: class II aldolase/adducin family protein [Phycisphaerae bacterium]|nr:class II aldolase/adducin family protein [Phycisphaerae bacterium]
MSTDWPLRREIVEIGRRIHERGFVAATDGNISCRTGGGHLLITGSGTALGELKPEDIVEVAPDGRIVSGVRAPSSEMALHLAVYRQRPDVQAVVHAHPPVATGFSFAGESLAQCVIPEVVLIFGTIPTTRYATPSSEEGPQVIRELIRDHDALILERHGSLTVGKSLRDAYHKLEKVEHAALVTLIARLLGKVIPLSGDELARLAAIGQKYGYGAAKDICKHCGGTGHS